MEFSEKMWLMIKIKAAKKTGFHALSSKHIFGKITPMGVGQIDPNTPTPPAFLESTKQF